MTHDLDIQVLDRKLQLNGSELKLPFKGEFAEWILGQPTRICEGTPPAPYGHRNNRWLIYDDLGLVLLQHHGTNHIKSIAVHLATGSDSVCVPFEIYSGNLGIDGQNINMNMTANDVGQIVKRKPHRMYGMFILARDPLTLLFEFPKSTREHSGPVPYVPRLLSLEIDLGESAYKQL